MLSLKSPNLEIASNGRRVSIQSLNKKPSLLKVQILIVDDDSTSLAIVSSMLKTCSLQDHMIELSVVTIKNPLSALETLRVKHGEFDLVVTDLHMPGMNGLQLQKLVNEEFKIPVILMSVDDKKSVIKKSLESGAVFYIVKPVNQQDLNNVLEHAVAFKKGKSIVIDDQEMGSNEELETLLSNEKVTCEDANSSSSSVNEDNSQEKQNGKKRERDEEQADEEDAPSAAKKAKVVWTNSLHNRFLQAINHIGLDKAVPKRILEFMCVPGLTRENVASHLQKYRMFLKKVAERGLWSSPLSERAYRSSFASGYSCGSSSMFGKYAHQDYSHLPGLQQFLKPTFHPGCGGPNNFFDLNNTNSISSFSFPNHQEASSSNSASHPCRYGQSSLLFANNNSTSANNFQRSMFGNPSYPFYQPNRSFNTTFGLINNATNPLTTSTITTSPINPNLYNHENPFKFGSGSSNYASSSYASLNPNSNYAGIRLTSDGELIGSGQVRFSTRNYLSSTTSFNSTNNASTSNGNGIFGNLSSQEASSSAAAGFGNANSFSPIFTTIANNHENTSMLPPPLVSSQQPQTRDTGIGLGNVGGGENDLAFNLMNNNNSPILNNISNNQQQLGDGEADLGELLFGSPNYTTPPRQQRILEGFPLDVNFLSSPYNGVNELLNAEFSSSCTLADKAPWTRPSSSQLHSREDMVNPNFGGNINSLDNYFPRFEQPHVSNNGEPLVSELNGMHIDDKAASSDNQEWGEDILDFLLHSDPY